MGYVDLRKRQEERTRNYGSPWECLVTNPYLAIAVGLGILVSWVALTYLFEDGLSAAVLMLALILTVTLLSGETWQLRRSGGAGPKFGLTSSSRQPATVHGDGSPVDVGGGVGGQEDDRALEVLGLAPAAGRDAGEKSLGAFGVAAQI